MTTIIKSETFDLLATAVDYIKKKKIGWAKLKNGFACELKYNESISVCAYRTKRGAFENIRAEAFNTKSGTVFDAAVFAPHETEKLQVTIENLKKIAIVILYLSTARKTDEGLAIQSVMTQYIDRILRGASETEIGSTRVILNNRVQEKFIKTEELTFSEFKTDSDSEYIIEKIYFGKPDIFRICSVDHTRSSGADLHEAAEDGCFSITKGREFTEKEKEMICKIPDDVTVSKNAYNVAKKIFMSRKRPLNLHRMNVLLEGPAGTGKTMDAKIISALLNVPYVCYTCHADADSTDVIGGVMPTMVDIGEIPKPPKFPDHEQIYFFPRKSYLEVTGIDKADATPADVLKAIAEITKSIRDLKTPNYEFFSSPIVEAFEKGYICEIQEAACITNPGMLTMLNSALERDGVIHLPDRVIKRHPDCIFIITTNRDYEGCYELNESVRDRMNISIDVPLPTEEELTKRIMKKTGCPNEQFVREFVSCMTTFNKGLSQMQMSLHVSQRGMNDFVLSMMDGFSVEESIDDAIINKITTEKEAKDEMVSLLLNSTKIYELELEYEAE